MRYHFLSARIAGRKEKGWKEERKRRRERERKKKKRERGKKKREEREKSMSKVKMWRNQNPCALMVGRESSIAAVKSSLAAAERTKHIITT